jgi:dihydroxyacetone kinase-like predicted kinase
VTDLAEQAGEAAIHGGSRGYAGFEPLPETRDSPIGVVAVAAGTGLLGVFRQLGAQGAVTGGQTMNPSTEDVLAAVEQVSADMVIILPNNKNIVPVAEQIDGLTTKAVAVVPTRSVTQGIAAMFGYDPSSGDVAGVVEDMAAAASSVLTGEITQAVRDATVDYGRIRRGDWLGIADGTIVVADSDIEAALRGLVAAIMMPGAELVTVYHGEGSSHATIKALEAWLSELHPRIGVAKVAGDQPLYPYLISIE